MTFLDLRYALRQMQRTPLLTVTILLTLTLGIGIVTTGATGVVAMLVRPLPFARDEATLVALFESQPKLGQTWKSVSVPNLRDWRAESRAFERIAAFAPQNYDVGGRDHAERVPGAAVSAEFFHVLGARAILGRVFVTGEDVAGRDRIVVLSDRLWERRFHRDRNVLGQSIDVNGVAHRVVGVVGRYVEYPEWTEIWKPLVLDPATSLRNSRWLNVVARLAPGRTIADAQADLDRVARDLEARFPDSNAGWGAFVRPLKEAMLPRAAQIGIASLLGGDILVLLLVCANVANLLLARASGRRQEMATRAALGATRARLFRQTLVESLLLSAIGGVGGVLAASWGLDLMVRMVPFEIPHWIHMDLDAQVLACSAVAALGSGLVFGTAPAWHLSLAGLAVVPRTDAGPTQEPRSRLRAAMLVNQFALSLVLLVAAVLLARSAIRVASVTAGFEPDRLMTCRVSLHSVGYQDPQRRAAVVDEIVRQMRRVPGVQEAAATNRLPMSRNGFELGSFETEGQEPEDRSTVLATVSATTADYPAVLGLPLRRGRLLDAAEVQRAAGVALVGESLAARLWPGLDPLGRRLRKKGNETERWFTVVGVVGDIARPYQLKGVDSWPDAQVYLPFTARPDAESALAPAFVARTPGDPSAVARDLVNVARQVAGDAPVYDVLTMRQVQREFVWLPVYWGQLFSMIAVLALVIAAVGIYGYTAYSVASRSLEFGIRVALGADPRAVVWLVLRRIVQLGAVAAGVGLPLAWLLSGALSSMLDNVNATDPVVYAGVTVFLFSVLLIAAYLPARRAAHADPSETLRAY